jgi:hypothetical protein
MKQPASEASESLYNVQRKLSHTVIQFSNHDTPSSSSSYFITDYVLWPARFRINSETNKPFKKLVVLLVRQSDHLKIAYKD